MFFVTTLQVKKHAILSQQHKEVIPAVAQVLAWSQRYMRDRKVHFNTWLSACTHVWCGYDVFDRMSAVLLA